MNEDEHKSFSSFFFSPFVQPIIIPSDLFVCTQRDLEGKAEDCEA